MPNPGRLLPLCLLLAAACARMPGHKGTTPDPEAAMNPTGIEIVPVESAPVAVADVRLEARLAAMAPRFDKPSDDAAHVMPVGAGDLSAMLRYDRAWEMHLSKTDVFGAIKPGAGFLSYGGSSILSPGHLQLDFGIAPEAIMRFEQRLDLHRGSVVLGIETAEGRVSAEAYGVMGGNVLVVAVEDTRSQPAVRASFSIWRPAMDVAVADGVLSGRQVHGYDESGKPVQDAAQVRPDDRFYNLGVCTVAALADASGLIAAAGETGSAGTDKTATLRAAPGRRYWFVIACATTYDGKPEAAAREALDAVVAANQARLLDEHLAWWQRFWQASYVDLSGKDADYLMRLWYTTLYSYGCVGDGPVLPKFNGGPGLVHQDDRHWWIGYWWQNTRELIWPMFAANHLRYAKAHLDFYDRTFMNDQRQTAAQGKIGIRVGEYAHPFKPGSVSPPKSLSVFDPVALEAAMANRSMEQVKSHYNARSMAQVAELVQLMFDWVAFSGEADYLRTVVAPWLKEAALFYLSYLKLEDDGLYHMTPSDGLEMWREVKDPMTDMCAVRYCFWRVIEHGAAFGYEPEFVATVRGRLDKLAPLPTGRWPLRAATAADIPPGRPPYIKPGCRMVDRIEPDDTQYAPAAAFLADRIAYNAEQPELYVIYPFALADAQSPPDDYARAVNAFKARPCSNTYGWSQDGIQAARLRLPETITVVMDHARRHQRYPYGGWVNAAVPLKGSKLNVSDVPYFDTAGVQMTALQEMLLQSHTLATPAKTDPFGGGPIVLLPAVPDDWAGRFRLRARGGFQVSVQFQAKRRIERLRIESERGQPLRLVNPFVECRITRGGNQVAACREAVLTLPTTAGDVLEFSGAAPRPTAP